MSHFHSFMSAARMHVAQAILLIPIANLSVSMVAVVAISGSTGFWVHVGHNLDGDAPHMQSDWVPCNARGDPVAVTRLSNGYWTFHKPGSHATVYFHRQVVIDVVRGGQALPADIEIHHKDEDPNNNIIANLSMITKTAHRILTGAARGRR